MGVSNPGKTFLILLLVFALLIGIIVTLNFISKDMFPESSGAGEEAPPSAYYYEGAEGVIDFDFSEPGILYDDGVVKYEAKDGYLFYGAYRDEAEGDAYPCVTFPLNKDGSSIKITDYSEIEFSFDLMYCWSNGIYKDFVYDATFFFNFDGEIDVETHPYGLRFAIIPDPYYDTGTPEYFGYQQTNVIDTSPFIEESEGLYRKVNVSFKLVVNKDDYTQSKVYTFIDGVKAITFTEALASDTLYGLTFLQDGFCKSDYIAGFDNFKVNLK